MKIRAFRLHPGEDILITIEKFLAENTIDAAIILACVGSLRTAALRFANQEEKVVLQGPFEILALSGVLSWNGSHYHISIADREGKTLGAHLMEGSEVFTTAEIVIGVLDGLEFHRVHDDKTGYPELSIKFVN